VLFVKYVVNTAFGNDLIRAKPFLHEFPGSVPSDWGLLRFKVMWLNRFD
jgi:hypothetical protein